MLSDNIKRNGEGVLHFASQDVTALAKEYGTPLYLMDEQRIRSNMRMYTGAFAACFRPGSRPLFASKAASFKTIYRIAKDEGMGVDCVSCGEIATALSAGFPAENIYFHGNCKTDADIRYAVENRVGCFVVDNADELLALERIAAENGIVQRAMLRLAPGIDPHTYAEVNTGMVDSKFGAAVETGQAMELVRLSLAQPHLLTEGVHCHVGSQVFDEDVYERTLDIMLPFMDRVRKETGAVLPVLNMGGGYGVRYLESDRSVDIPARIADVAQHFRSVCAALDFPEPIMLMEPGRSIVADAGMTVYTVGAVKRIPGYKNYVIVDGGMGDNPRYALYKAPYTVYHAAKTGAAMRCDLAGRCCESGDILRTGVELPEDTCRGDIVCVCTTGAYNFSMASNYNRLGRPAVVMLSESGNYVAVKRESIEDMLERDV
ncbi:MAG: diaminopimelate decarboxylase [Clostridiales bacterium]|nr:diaminopimelate decarboxylase [Candidatus Apopatocola equi]